MVLPPKEVQAPGVAILKPPKEKTVPKMAHASEVANGSLEAKVLENYEISMNYVHNGKLLDRESTEIDDVYDFFVAFDIIMNSDPEP